MNGKVLNYIGHNQWDGKRFPEFYEKVVNGNYDKIIIFGQNEWEWYQHDSIYWKKLLTYCKNIGKPLHVITAAHRHLFPVEIENTIVDWWDTYWIGRTYQVLVHTKNDKFIDPTQHVDYKYRFISMNNRAHTHRCLLLDLLEKYKLIGSNAVSFHQYSSLYAWKYFKHRPLILEPEFPLDHDQNRVPSQYYDSFMQLVAESTEKIIIMSEKTVMPLLFCKPFLVAGQMHFHKFLKGLGFQLYDEIFDYSFDDEPIIEKRYEMLLKNVWRLQLMPIKYLTDLQKKIVGKLKYNQQHALEIAYDLNLYPAIAKEVIEYYKETGIAIDHSLVAVHENLEKYKHTYLARMQNLT